MVSHAGAEEGQGLLELTITKLPTPSGDDIWCFSTITLYYGHQHDRIVAFLSLKHGVERVNLLNGKLVEWCVTQEKRFASTYL